MFLFAIEGNPVVSMTNEKLTELMNEYGTQLLRLCYLYLKDYQLAEDAVSETFIKVYTKHTSFKGKSSIKTWITSIAINVCKDMMRKRSYSERPLYLPADPQERQYYEDKLISFGSVGFENPQEEIDIRLDVIKAVSELPEIYRQTILLYYYQGLTTEEIAVVQNCAKATV
ncbi:MAG: sigma-70 family RNA polymerase sigma factor, partial [Clostridiales bacterium]|nr:sigma-70 family RNA polymerase sigma factor [Clostridiales bacterium]